MLGYYLSAGILLFLTAIFAVFIWLYAVCCTRRHNDAARSWFAICGFAFGLFILSIVFSSLSYVLHFVTARKGYVPVRGGNLAVRGTDPIAEAFSLQAARFQTTVLGIFFEEFAFILVLFVLVRLAAGIRTAHDIAKSTVDTQLRTALFVTLLLLGNLNIAAFALHEILFLDEDNDILFIENGLRLSANNRRVLSDTKAVILVMHAVGLVAALALLARSIFFAMQTRSRPRMSTPIVNFVICCALLLLRVSYELGYNVHYTPVSGPDSLAMAGILLSCWPLLAVFVRLLVLATKKENGIRSNEQPLKMMRPDDQGVPLQAPSGYEYGQQPQHPQSGHTQQPREQTLPAPHSGHGLSPQHGEAESEDAVGLNHQADGRPPRTDPLPYAR